MTTSGTAGWNPGTVSIVNGALRLIGAIASGETPPDNEFQDALDALNGLIKAWQVSGVHVWTQTEATVFLQPGQARYAIGVAGTDHASETYAATRSSAGAAAGAAVLPVVSAAGLSVGDTIGVALDDGAVFWSAIASVAGSSVTLTGALPSQASAGAQVVAYAAPFARPLRVIGARAVALATGVETPLIPMSRLDYANLSGKTVPNGPPAQYFYDPQLGSGVLSLFPAPSNGLTAVTFTCQRPLQDVANAANTADVPQEWVSALRFALAVELAPEYDCPAPRFEMLKAMAAEKFAVVQKWDVEGEGTTSSAFAQPVYQIIAGALRLCGGCAPQNLPTWGQVENARYSLNAVIQGWQANGIHVWTQTEMTQALTVGQAQYTVASPRPLRVVGMRLVSASGTETPLIPMSRLDYANLSGKTVQGAPVQFFYDPQVDSGIISLYPAPADATATVHFTAQRQLLGVQTLNDDLDFPPEWLDALRLTLAWRLSAEYGTPPEIAQALKVQADEALAVVQRWDVEAQGTTTYPFGQPLYQMIAGALRLCGAVGPQDVPRLGLVENAFTALNAMVQAWQASGIHVWAEEDVTVFLQPGQIRYLLGGATTDNAAATAGTGLTWLAATAVAGASGVTLADAAGIAAGSTLGVWLDAGTVFWTSVTAVAGAVPSLAAPLPSQASGGAMAASYAAALVRPLRMPAGRRLVLAAQGAQPIEVPLVPMSRIDYANLPNKATPGTVTQFFYDPQLGSGVLNVWPAPSDARCALRFTAQRPLTTFAGLDSAPDFPDEWLAALRWNLAAELWPEYNGSARPGGNPGQYALLKQEAAAKLLMAQGWDREPQSVLFGAGMGPAGRSG